MQLCKRPGAPRGTFIARPNLNSFLVSPSTIAALGSIRSLSLSSKVSAEAPSIKGETSESSSSNNIFSEKALLIRYDGLRNYDRCTWLRREIRKEQNHLNVASIDLR